MVDPLQSERLEASPLGANHSANLSYANSNSYGNIVEPTLLGLPVSTTLPFDDELAKLRHELYYISDFTSSTAFETSTEGCSVEGSEDQCIFRFHFVGSKSSEVFWAVLKHIDSLIEIYGVEAVDCR